MEKSQYLKNRREYPNNWKKYGIHKYITWGSVTKQSNAESLGRCKREFIAKPRPFKAVRLLSVTF